MINLTINGKQIQTLEGTTIFGEALQGACDGTYTSEEAYELINEDLADFAATM